MRNLHSITASLFCLMLSFSACCSQAEENWAAWRGVSGNGTGAPDAKLPTQWSDTENVRWKVPVPGRGHGTPIVWGDSVFLTAAVPTGKPLAPKYSGRPGAHDNLPVTSEQQFVLIAYDRATGQERWKRVLHEAIPIEGAHNSASLASASPVTDGEHVYAFFGSFGLFCLDFEGNVKWQKQFGQMHTKHGHGEGTSPVLHNGVLVINWDHEEQSFITALDAKSGKPLWRKERSEVTSWSTPLVVDFQGTEHLIVAGTEKVRSYELRTGKVLWECGGMSANIVATPVHKDGVVIVGSSYEIRIMLGIQLEGAQGDITDSENVLWSRKRGTPYVPSMLLSGDGLYFLAHYQNILTRLDYRTGRESPGAMRLGDLTSIYASPVAAGGYVYITDLDGTTMVISDTEIPRPIAVNVIGEPVNASLALAGNQIFIRSEKHLFCIEKPE